MTYYTPEEICFHCRNREYPGQDPPCGGCNNSPDGPKMSTRKEFRENSKKFYTDRKEHFASRYNVNVYNAKEMGMIKSIDFGLRDIGIPCLWFTMDGKAGGSLQCLFYPEYEYFIHTYGVSSISELKGKPIWMLRIGGLLLYVEPYI